MRRAPSSGLPVAALVALAGYWLPWLAGPAAALQLNAYELSEWVTFLPGVFIGELPFGRLSFLLPSACLAGLFAIAAARARQAPPRGWLGAWWPEGPLGWGLVALAGLCVAAVFPYYPYLLTAYADPAAGFQMQFYVAVAATLALPLLVVAPDDVASLAQIALAVTGAALSAWLVWAVQPAAAEVLGQPWPLGPGGGVAVIGFGLAALNGWRRLFHPRPTAADR